ncbi:MAG TPA: PepSY domain-containing protein [Umezawaea sp.]|nr:PepSY domain-containing protein [Umezawaea sp.]
MRGLVLRLHFYAGVLVGPFVLIAAVTGVLHASTPQLESWLYHGVLSVPVSARALPLAEQVRAARAVDPAGAVTAVRPAPEPGATTRVLFSEPGLGDSERRAVFVDPGTGRVTGTLVAYGRNGVLPLRTALGRLHRDLLLGEPGRLYSRLAASWLWVVVLGGAALWLTRSSARPATGGRRAHGVVGMWVLTGALVLSVTGLACSASGDDAPPSRAGARTADASRVDAVLGSARAAGIGAGAVEIELPEAAGAPWKVSDVGRGFDAVAVDGASGAVVGSRRFADYPLAAKVARWGVDAHTGVLFGWPNQVLLLVVGLGLVALVVLGYRMWWRRRPVRATAWSFGRPIARGQWRKAPTSAVVGLLVVGGTIGWFVPLLGASLAAFLVVDVLLGARARRVLNRGRP